MSIHQKDWRPLFEIGEFVREVLSRKKPRLVFDVGSNRGDTVAKWLDAGAEKVVCFEPVPSMHKLCLERWNKFLNVFVIRAGVSDVCETVEGLSVFNAWSLAQSGSRLDVALDSPEKPFDVDFVTLDSVRSAPVDFVKIDVDGMEYRVLKGMTRILKEDRPPIMFEYSHLPWFMYGQDVGDMCHWIYDHGYKAYSLAGWECPSASEMAYHCPDGSSYDIMLLPV